MMNKQLRLLVFMLLGISQSVAACCVTDCVSSCNSSCGSHQFVPRSITTDLVYNDALTYYQRYFRQKDKWLIYTGTLLDQRSTKDRQLGAAFLTNKSNQVTVGQAGTPDINAVWLGLNNPNPATPFSAIFSIDPQDRTFGYHGNWYFNLDSWWCGLWLDVSSAILNRAHKLRCCETDVNPVIPSCPNSAVSDALNAPNQRYSKFFCGLCNNEKRRTGIDDIQVRLGYNYNWCDTVDLGVYAIGTIPAGRNPTNEFIFEPLVGSKHASAGIGFNGHYNLWCNDCGDHNFTLMTDFNYRFVFNHNECRTFDLCPNGALSRFLLVAPSSDRSISLPGVNFFTQKVKVQPRSTIQWWVALNYEYCNLDFEVGYNLYWRQKERLNCLKGFCADVGIFDINGGENPTSLSNATIATGPGQIAADSRFTSLSVIDLNGNSATAGSALTNKVYGAFSWNGNICNSCFDWMAGVGASYEFVSNNSKCNALPFWGVFGKANISF